MRTWMAVLTMAAVAGAISVPAFAGQTMAERAMAHPMAAEKAAGSGSWEPQRAVEAGAISAQDAATGRRPSEEQKTVELGGTVYRVEVDLP